jgi:formylglycine-generating enzyme required for sulfatase activity
VVDLAGATTIQQKAPTLPDLDEQIAARQTPGQREVESGANTWALTVTDSEDQASPPRPKGGADTNLLPGTAGARSEQQAPTSIIDMGRTTGPVEERPIDVQKSAPRSGELAPALPASGDDQPSRRSFEEPAEPSEVKKPTTADFASDLETSSAGPESKTEIFRSPVQPAAPTSPPVSEEGIGTRQFEPRQSSAGAGTREIPPPAPPTSFDPLRTTEQRALVPEWSSPAQAESGAAHDLEQPEQVDAPVTVAPSAALPQKRTGMTIASAVVALIIIGGAVYAGWWFLFARVRPAPPVVVVEQPPPPVVPAPPEKPPAPVVPEGMLAVGAGSYTIGRDNADPLEKPEHIVDLPSFLIDRTEVTNAAYKKFIDATGHSAPTNWGGKNFPAGTENSPVTGVTWQDAADYAAWAGKRLPTEMEWEAAARGADGRIYPWGKTYRPDAANIGSKPDDITADQYPSGIKPVGRFPQGASPVGALDMIGNAWEWVSDEIAPYPGNTEAKLKLTPGITYRVIRGGAYDGNKSHDATYRGFLDASEAYPKVGFRCAKDAK